MTPSIAVEPASSTPRPIDEIDAAIIGLARKMNAECHHMLMLIREFDERLGWMKWSSTSCADWLHWRCDLSISAAREQVRVAHALSKLPLISAEFACGRLSYSKVRALTRVANAQDEEDLVRMAMGMTAAHVEQHCRRRHNAGDESTSDALRAHTRRSLRSWRNERRGLLTITIEVPIAEGLLFERAIDKASADLGASNSAPDDSTSWAAIQADAAIALARSYLDGVNREPGVDRYDGREDSGQAPEPGRPSGDSQTGTADHYQVVIHVDHAALTGTRSHGTQPHGTQPHGTQGQSDLPIAIVKRLCCDASIVPIVENGNGEPLSVGRRQRVVSTAIRRALWARDRGCAFPGCSHSRFVDAHHVRHWADGGETSLANLVLLCSAHHQKLHEGGYTIGFDQLGSRHFRRPDGRIVPSCGYRVDDWQDDYSDNDYSNTEDPHNHQRKVDAADGTETSAEGFCKVAPTALHAREGAAVYRAKPGEIARDCGLASLVVH